MLIVQTTRRKDVDYLTSTLAQVGDVGARRKIIVSDGSFADGFKIPEGWQGVQLPKRGARATGWDCMRMALAAGVPDLILLQDDLDICKDGGLVMDRTVVPDTCIAATFYSPSALPSLQPKDLGRPRLIVIGASGTAQALKFPRRAMQYLCGKDPLSAHNIPPLHPHLFDDALFSLARFSPTPHVAHVVPNPVRHVGHVSACGSTNPHHPRWTVDKESSFPADAATLPIFETLYPGAPPR